MLVVGGASGAQTSPSKAHSGGTKQPAKVQSFTQVFPTVAESFITPRPTTIPKFDPALGHLDRVTFRLELASCGRIGFENLGPIPVSDDVTATAKCTLYRRDGSTIPTPLSACTVQPWQQWARSLSVFDGSIDWAGPSGYQALARLDSTVTVVLDGDELYSSGEALHLIGKGPIEYTLGGRAATITGFTASIYTVNVYLATSTHSERLTVTYRYH